MSRTKYVYARDPETRELLRNEKGELILVEVGGEYRTELRNEGKRSEEEIYGHSVATDGTPLDTRRKHREYMERNGLTVASDYTNTWEKARAERAKVLAGDFDHKGRREDIGRAIYNLETRKRR